MQQAGNPTAYALHLRKGPRPGMPEKHVIFQFAKGDQTVPSPTAILRAGELADRATYKRAQVAGVFDRHDRWILRRLRAFVAKRWRNGLWRRYPALFWVHLGLTRLYSLRRDFLRELEVRRRAGNRPVERSAGDPHATFVRGTEALP